MANPTASETSNLSPQQLPEAQQLLHDLKISPCDFSSKVTSQVTMDMQIFETHRDLIKEITAIYSQVAKALARPKKLLNSAALKKRIVKATGMRPNAVSEAKSADGFGFPQSRAIVERSGRQIERMKETVLGLLPQLGREESRHEAHVAAKFLHAALNGHKRIGYKGALLLCYLGYDPLPPTGTTREDPAINRFWTYKTR